jgi:CheY-like chemotaxis protein
MFRQQPCDLVIADIFMPGKSGFDAIFELKSQYPQVKIIAISGGATAAHGGERWNRYHGAFGAGEALDMAKHYGADYILPKPIAIQKLVETINELLQVADHRSYLDRREKPDKKPVAHTVGEARHVLVIDDDTEQRNMFEVILRDAGYAVHTACDGREGVRLFEQQPCEVVITDIFMPREDGIDTIAHLKTLSPGVKIIAISGGGHWEPHGEFVGPDRSLAMASHFGADRIIEKPVGIHQLLDCIKTLESDA